MNNIAQSLLCQLQNNASSSNTLLNSLLDAINNMQSLLNDDHVKLESVCVLVDGIPAIATPVIRMRDGLPLGVTYVNDLGTLISGTVTQNPDPCTCLNCVSCDKSVCFRFDGFDNSHSIYQPSGSNVTFDILSSSTSLNASLIVDYAATFNGTNISTWYTQLANFINASPDWKMTVLTDVTAMDTDSDGRLDSNGKVIWKLAYTGTSPNANLVITKGSTDQYIFEVANWVGQTKIIDLTTGDVFNTPAIAEIINCK